MGLSRVDGRALTEKAGSSECNPARWPQLGNSAKASEIITLLARLVSVYGAMDKSESEWRAFWRVYTDVLSGLPLASIEAGILEYERQPDANFFPKPGPLHALCAAHANRSLDTERAEAVPAAAAWSWPSDLVLSGMGLHARRREYRIMASECRNRAGAMDAKGVHPRPDWIVKAKHYEAEARRMSELIAKGAQSEEVMS